MTCKVCGETRFVIKMERDLEPLCARCWSWWLTTVWGH
jgi:hypothetical protein